MKSKIWKVLTLCLVGLWFNIAAGYSYNDDIPNWNGNDAHYWKMENHLEYDAVKKELTGAPVLYFKIWCYNSYGEDDYINKGELQYKIEGLDTDWETLFIFYQDQQKADNAVNDASNGQIKYFGVELEGTSGFRHFWQKADWHLPSRALGRRVQIRLHYQWYHNNKNQGWKDYETSVTLPTISAPEVQSKWITNDGTLSLESTWKNYSPNTKMELRIGGKNATLDASAEKYSLTGLDMNESVTVEWSNYLDWKYTWSEVTRTVRAERLGSYSVGKNVKPTSLSGRFDLCDSRVVLDWALGEGTKQPITIFRRETGGSYTEIASLSSTATTYTDGDCKLDKNYEYAVAAIPNGYDKTAFESYGTYSSVKVSTYMADITLPKLTIKSTGGGSSFLISWSRLTSLCSDAKLQLIKEDEEAGKKWDVDLSKDATQYTDNSVTACTTYKYYLKLTTKGKTFNGVSSLFSVSDASKFTSIIITKGVYSDKVKITWETDKPKLVDEYIIERKGIDEEDIAYQKIAQFKDNSTRVEYIDADVVPGTYYRYRVKAISKCSGSSVTSDISEIGFALPYGTVSGRIQFKGGTSVGDVCVRLQKVNSDEEVEQANRSLEFSGDGYAVATFKNQHTCAQKSNFSFQSYVYIKEQIGAKAVIADLNNEFQLWVEGNATLKAQVGDAIVSYPLGSELKNQFVQVTVTSTGNDLKLYIDGVEKASESASRGTCAGTSLKEFYLGNSSTKDNGFVGHIDETRLWQKALTAKEVLRNYAVYISGTESGLSAYWQFDENLKGYFFDLAHKDFTYYENNGELYMAKSSTIVPTHEQLSLMAYTDSNGNYLIRGIPTELEGTTYQIVPTFGTHQFEPSQQIRHLGGGGLSVINSIDFSDISSFRVQGTAVFEGTQFPVEGAIIYIDGEAATVDGKMVTTNAEGRYLVDVPIGNHFIEMRMQNHVFANNGRWPAKEGDKHNFQNDIPELNFIDNTLIKFAGRVVGGKVQTDKKLGFSLSKNNLGNGTVTLQPQKTNYYLTEVNNGVNSKQQNNLISGDKYSAVDIYKDVINIKTNSETGEFVAFLPPIKFNVTDVSAGNYQIGSDQLTPVDLTAILDNYEIYEYEIKETEGDKETIIQKTDSFYYNEKRIYSYIEPKPTVTVTQVGKKYADEFGEKVFKYLDDVTQQTDSVNLYTVEIFGEEGQKEEVEIVQAFGKPVFNQGVTYQLKIEAYEQYRNTNTGDVDSYPFVDGKILINNGFSISKGSTPQQLELLPDSSGVTIYPFMGGLPNVSTAKDPNDNFTVSLEINVRTNAGASSKWPEAGPMPGYVLGAMPSGNNFVTQGPDQIVAILRDPPGSNSSLTMEKGSTVKRTTGVNMTQNIGGSFGVTAHLGPKFEIGTGFLNNEMEVINDLGYKVTTTNIISNSNEKSSAVSFSETMSTSSDPAYVGTMGDVFVGNSTNIIYGNAKTIGIYPVGGCEEAGAVSGKFAIGKHDAFRMDLSFGTIFAYTENHIENYLIPNLEMLRNTFLTTVPDPASAVNNSDKVRYFTKLKPGEEGYGTNNDDEIWGEDAVPVEVMDKGTGRSYTIKLPNNADAVKNEVDSVAFFNKQISQWRFYLRENEKEKVQATNLLKNHSFDAGVEQTHTSTSCSSRSMSYNFSFAMNNEFNTATGGTFGGLGAQVDFSFTDEVTEDKSNSEEAEECLTFSYTLADENQGDYFSVDVLDCGNANNSPVFKTRGGQSSCPYEGESSTKYYAPGTVISEATMQIEKPQISVKQPIADNVAGGGEAYFNLQLRNASEVDASAYYRLMVDDDSNANGATLSIDGVGITGEGRLFKVEAGQTLDKTLVLRQSRTDVHDFENIRLVFASDCQYDPTDDIADIADTISISAYFKPSSSDFKLSFANDQTLVNSVTGTSLPLIVENLQRDYINFAGVALEYKPETSSTWITEAYYANTQAEFDRAQGNKFMLETNSINYNWEMYNLIDGVYQVRVRTISKDASGGFIAEKLGTPLSLRKDVASPKEMGKPQPTDGILNPGEDIAVFFNEDINQPMVTRFNLSVQGELNGHKVRDNVGLEFAGENDFARTEAMVNLENKSFTIEMWTKRTLGTSGTVFSHGSSEESMNIAFDKDNYLHVLYKDKDLKSALPVNDPNWIHLAVVYNVNSKTISAVVSSQMVAEKDKEIIKLADFGEYKIIGEVRVGHSLNKNLKGGTYGAYKGCINELRIWNKTKSLVDIYAESRSTLSGLEMGLIAYWPMVEGYGLEAKEKVGAKNLRLNTSWYVYPKGYAAQFNGTDNLLQLNTVVPLTPDNNYTVEGWFKGENQSNSKLFAYAMTPKMSQNLQDSTILAIGFNEKGKLIVTASSENFETGEKTFLDNQWHHFALVVNRSAKAQFYIDGEMYITTAASKFPYLMGGRTYLGGESAGKHLYRGLIDEIRVWSTALTLDQIEIDMNSRKVGDETGLIAYYPFEKYLRDDASVLAVNPTLEDQMTNSTLQNGGEATLTGANVLVNSGATIKDVRPTENVLFDYTVSDRAILVSLLEPVERIENCVLEFTVNGVQDLRGNTQTSPVKWTAFVNQNTMRWQEKDIVVSKKSFEPASFEATIINTAGNKQNFAIDNMPEWVTASAVSGVLQPLETKTIKFTIEESLNIGRYEEIFYLRGNLNISAPLLVNVKVVGDKPDWSVNPKDFQYSMNVVGSLSIEDVLSTDKEDIVAAFDGETCVGIASPEYITSHDIYELFMTVYNHKKEGAQLTFKVWDASTGRIYPTVLPNDVTFTSDVMLGTIDQPVKLNAIDEVKLDWNLGKGWSWVSSNVQEPLQSDVFKLLDPIKLNLDLFKGDVAYAQYYEPYNEWRGDINSYGGVLANKSYLVNMKSAGKVELIGKQLKSSDVNIPLERGWNYIGYIPSLVAPIKTALATLSANDGDVIKSQTQFAMYYHTNGGWIGSLKYLRPGEGYMINVRSDQTFKYPTINTGNSNAAGTKAAKRTVESPVWDFNPSEYEYNMNMIAKLYDGLGELDMNNYEIGVFAGDVCRGIAEVIENHAFITIMGNQKNEQLSVKVYDKNTNKVVVLKEPLIFQENTVLGTGMDPIKLIMGNLTDLSDESADLIGIYPNPVQNILNIQIDIKDLKRYVIRDVSGKELLMQDNPQSLKIDLSHLIEGVYIITIETNDASYRRQFIKKN